MEATKIMETEVVACGDDQTLAAAIDMMKGKDCGAIPIVAEDGKVRGILTDRDACIAVREANQAPDQIPVTKAMSESLTTCGPDEELGALHAKMRERLVRRLVVVDENQKLQGMVSIGDLAARAASVGDERQLADVGMTLGTICLGPPPKR